MYWTLAACTLLVLGIWRYQRKAYKLPPGPPANLFGNFHHIPRTQHSLAYKKFGEQYGKHTNTFHFYTTQLNSFFFTKDLSSACGGLIIKQSFSMTTRLPMRSSTSVQPSTRTGPLSGWVILEPEIMAYSFPRRLDLGLKSTELSSTKRWIRERWSRTEHYRLQSAKSYCKPCAKPLAISSPIFIGEIWDLLPLMRVVVMADVMNLGMQSRSWWASHMVIRSATKTTNL